MQYQLQSHDPLGPFSCTTYAGAMAIDYDRLGAVVPTGREVRTEEGDTSGGTNLAQLDAAAQHWGVDLDVRYRYPWDTFIRRIAGGAAAVLQGGYAPIAATKFDAGNGFKGNHAILVRPGLVAMDPLADGRRVNVYQYQDAPYPATLLRSFAAHLNTGSRVLGDGLVYAAFTRVHADKAARVTIHPLKGTRGYPKSRYFNVFTVSGTQIVKVGEQRTGGFSASCTEPQRFGWSGHPRQLLVRLTSGAYAGEWVREAWVTP
jgi:hypothetical protein